jgi:hypothetical protein
VGFLHYLDQFVGLYVEKSHGSRLVTSDQKLHALAQVHAHDRVLGKAFVVERLAILHFLIFAEKVKHSDVTHTVSNEEVATEQL